MNLELLVRTFMKRRCPKTLILTGISVACLSITRKSNRYVSMNIVMEMRVFLGPFPIMVKIIAKVIRAVLKSWKNMKLTFVDSKLLPPKYDLEISPLCH